MANIHSLTASSDFVFKNDLDQMSFRSSPALFMSQHGRACIIQTFVCVGGCSINQAKQLHAVFLFIVGLIDGLRIQMLKAKDAYPIKDQIMACKLY
ncbi:MAG: hypothetical protein AB1743_08055 [Actinomycetota bacterium]